jgi:hypothetical protein
MRFEINICVCADAWSLFLNILRVRKQKERKEEWEAAKEKEGKKKNLIQSSQIFLYSSWFEPFEADNHRTYQKANQGLCLVLRASRLPLPF